MGYFKILSVHCLFLTVLFIHCFNPFFPQTAPYIKPYLATPGAVIEELWEAYKNQDLARFDSLFYDKDDFKFLISPDVIIENNYTNFKNSYVVPDSLKYFLLRDNYVYLTYSDERKIHNNLFSPSIKITTDNTLYYREEFIIPDTVTNPATYKPVEAKVYTGKATILIERDTSIFEFNIEEQLFLVRKNDDDRWKMRYWLELD